MSSTNLPPDLARRAGDACARVLSRNLGLPITRDLMLDVRETPTGLCTLVLETLGLAPFDTVRVPPPVDVSAFGDGAGRTFEPALTVQTWRLRALEEDDHGGGA